MNTARTRALAAIAAALVWALGAGVASGQDYYTAGSVEASIYHSVGQGTVTDGESVASGEQRKQFSLEVELTGPNGNSGTARSAASLYDASLHAYAHGVTPSTSAGHGSGMADGALYDTLSCTIPAGTYPDGVDLTVRGRIAGSLAITGPPDSWVRAQAQARLFSGTVVQYDWDQDDGGNFARNFVLSEQFVAPGVTLPSPHVSQTILIASLRVDAFSSGSSVSTATADFESSLRLFEMEVSGGFECTSGSGVLLTASEVPALQSLWPYALVLLMAAAGGWSLLARRTS